MNNKRIQKNNKTGVEGVSIVDDGEYHYYRARATVDGKRVALEFATNYLRAVSKLPLKQSKKAKQLTESPLVTSDYPS